MNLAPACLIQIFGKKVKFSVQSIEQSKPKSLEVAYIVDDIKQLYYHFLKITKIYHHKECVTCRSYVQPISISLYRSKTNLLCLELRPREKWKKKLGEFKTDHRNFTKQFRKSWKPQKIAKAIGKIYI